MLRGIYCLNGHCVDCIETQARSWHEVLAIAERIENGPIQQKLYCPRCGAKNISVCPKCDVPIEVGDFGTRNAYCSSCGSPYPWTESALACAKEYTEELDGLSREDKESLKKSFDQLTSDTAQTAVAASRFKRITSKLGSASAEALTKIIVEVATQGAKKLMGL